MFGYPDGATCDLPVEWSVRVLEARVREAVGGGITFTVTAADALPLAEYGALMAEVYSMGDDFPVALVDERIVCAGALDHLAVIAAVATSAADV